MRTIRHSLPLSRCPIQRLCVFLAFLAIASAGPLCSQIAVDSSGSDAVGEAAISLTSPLDYQVFQRRALMKGKVEIRGQVNAAAGHVADRIEARLTGTSLNGPLPGQWVRLTFHKATGAFRGSLATIPGGFYSLEVRALRAQQPVAQTTVPHVGVGEVFVVSGQSNSTNYGEVRQVTATRMVVAFDGTSWRIADDPQPGVQDHSSKGSFIPAFGDALYRRYHVPIGVASVGHGSTSVRQWLPAGDPVYVMPTMTRFVIHDAHNRLVSDGTLFNGMMARIHQLGKRGFRALLWHQGESDANQPPAHQISAELYRKMMIELIQASRKDAGWNFPWFVAEATYHPNQPSSPSFQQAQRSLWRKGLAYEGPDTDTLGPEYRQNHGQGVHFNNQGLRKHGEMWAQAVEVYLDEVLR